MKSFVLGAACALTALSVGLVGCGKDPPKKVDDGPKTSTPVPSDMVFNDFVPSNGASGGITGVKGDASIAVPEGAGGADPASPPPAEAAADDQMKLKVTEPGAEPRAVRKYAFAVGKVDRRLMTTKQSVSREGQPGQDQTFTVLADFTPKTPKPSAMRYEMKILKVDAPDAPPAMRAQAVQQLAVFTGLVGQFDVSVRGQIGEVDFKADEKMAGGGAEMILQAIQQSLQSAEAELPLDAIGVGAKWEGKQDRKEGGMTNSVKKSYTLTDATAEGGTIEQEIVVELPKHPFQQRGAPPGATEEAHGVGKYVFQFKWDHLATKVAGELAITHKIEVPAGQGAPKQGVSEVVKLKNQFDVPPAGK